jgi:hypothetical protein
MKAIFIKCRRLTLFELQPKISDVTDQLGNSSVVMSGFGSGCGGL